MKKLFLLIILINFSACNQLDKKLEGIWTIREIIYEGKVLPLHEFLSNTIIFKEDSCKIPLIDIRDRDTDKEIIQWSTYKEKNAFYLKIDSEQTIFGGIYQINFIENSSPLEMTLSSYKLTIKCAKLLT